ncbi:MAG: hypothetical protein ACLQIB_57520, partial [Isosphaeraceae bacterium]
QASRLPARGMQARRLHHNDEVAELILAQRLTAEATHGRAEGYDNRTPWPWWRYIERDGWNHLSLGWTWI